jgi:hypothetical protein
MADGLEEEIILPKAARIFGDIGSYTYNNKADIHHTYDSELNTTFEIIVDEIGNSGMAIFEIYGGVENLKSGKYYYFDSYNPHSDDGILVFAQGCSGYRVGEWDYDAEARTVELWISETPDLERFATFRLRFNSIPHQLDEKTVSGFAMLN